ncbi:MAG: AAA family ATPase [Planctomycetia bacterium]|nr:AAA family ATPase [Planctomycetia bacterium]
MRITSLDIERFGIWEQLHLPQISSGLNVFYGPNEAGKTTLMQFIRSSLYGCADDERARYIQMVLEKKKYGVFEGLEKNDSRETQQESSAENDWNHWVGGTLTVNTDFGDYRLQRRYIRQNTSAYDRQTILEMKSGFIATGGLANWSGRFYPLQGKGIAESLIVSGPDGARLSDYFVKTLVNNIDEATFNNVFAIGLDELQRLGTLNETDAAQMLYRLSVGLDRVSLVQVLHQLIDERNEIFDVNGKPAILENLLAQKEKIIGKSTESSFLLREYSRILTEQQELQETIRQLQEKIEKNDYQKRVYETAQKIAPIWDERVKIRSEINDLGEVVRVEKEAIQQADNFQRAIEKTQNLLQQQKQQFLKLLQDRNALVIDENLWQIAPRIEMLQDDLPRLKELDEQIGIFQTEINDLGNQLYQEEQRLKGARSGKVILTQNAIDQLINETQSGSLNEEQKNNDSSGQERTSKFSVEDESTAESIREVEDYREPAKAVRRQRQRLEKIQEQYKQVNDRLKILSEKLDKGLTSHGQKNLKEALEKTSDLVSGLRRRQEIAQRLNEMAQYRKELERRNANLVANQTLPTGVLTIIGAGVALGGLLFGLSLFRTEIELGWGLLGLIVVGACLIYKSTIEKKNFVKLEENQRQLGILLKQIENAKEEASVIDARFPAPGQSIEVRLQKAQTDFSFFEKMVPIDAQWKETNHHFQLLESRLEKAKNGLQNARKGWINWLKIAGLPNNLKPSQIKEMLERVDIAEDLRRHLDALKNEIELYKRERKGILDHLDFVLGSIEFSHPEENSPFILISLLKDHLENARQIKVQRQKIQNELNQIRKERKRQKSLERKQKLELSQFLESFGIKTIEELIRLEERYQNYCQKQSALTSTEQQLIVGIGGVCEEQILAELLDDLETRSTLPEQEEKIRQRLQTLNEEHRTKIELSGRMDEQLANLAKKKDSIRYQFERYSIDIRMNEMATLWKSRAVASRIMEDIRKAYEKERQPETLREASKLLRVLTGGRYLKIWTPLGEDTLYIDDFEGKTLDVSALSRGAREQLFIAIRLALTTSFEKHGVQLPLILDDVLVNFDNQRAWAAAKLLNHFARTGRQIFLFTCHKHICQIFLKMKTPVVVLPDRNRKNKRFRVLLPAKEKRNEEIVFNQKAKTISLTIDKKKEKTTNIQTISILPQESFSFDSSRIQMLMNKTINGSGDFSDWVSWSNNLKTMKPYKIDKSLITDSNITIVDKTSIFDDSIQKGSSFASKEKSLAIQPSISLNPDSMIHNAELAVLMNNQCETNKNDFWKILEKTEPIFVAAYETKLNATTEDHSFIVDKNNDLINQALIQKVSSEKRESVTENELMITSKKADRISTDETLSPYIFKTLITEEKSLKSSFPIEKSSKNAINNLKNDIILTNQKIVGQTLTSKSNVSETIDSETEDSNLTTEILSNVRSAKFEDSDKENLSVSTDNSISSNKIEEFPKPSSDISVDSESSKSEIDLLNENRRKATLRDVLLAGHPHLSSALNVSASDEPEIFLENLDQTDQNEIDLQERLARKRLRKRKKHSHLKKMSKKRKSSDLSLRQEQDSDQKSNAVWQTETEDKKLENSFDPSAFDVLETDHFDDAWADVLTTEHQNDDDSFSKFDKEESSENSFLRDFFVENNLSEIETGNEDDTETDHLENETIPELDDNSDNDFPNEEDYFEKTDKSE